MRKSAPYYDGITTKELTIKTGMSLELFENYGLITTNAKGEVYFTPKGKIARDMGFSHYLHFRNLQKELANENFISIQSEKKDLSMIFGGMFVSLCFIIIFWALHLEYIL